MKTLHKWILIAASAAMAGCGPAEAPDTRVADGEAIRKLDAEWAKAAQTRKTDAFVAYYADDAVVLPPNEKMATTMADIRKCIDGLMGLPNLNISWEASRVEVARSGDLGYLYGKYKLSFADEKGQTIRDEGKVLEIWKKQANGSWKCIVDTWNSDMPLPPPPTK